VGSPGAFFVALSVVVLWMMSGPIFHFSDTWQLVINTGTTIVTFLMVFVIQHTQNRDTEALRLKVDELICALDSARDELLDVEDMEDTERHRIALAFQKRGAVANRGRSGAVRPRGGEKTPPRS
jgi:low affinity Fe/Cu permease